MCLPGKARTLKAPKTRSIARIGQVEKGLEPPSDLVSACNLLGEVKTFQDDCLQVVFHTSPPLGELYEFPSLRIHICELLIQRAKVLDDANSSAEKMTFHQYAQKNIEAYRAR